MAKNANFVSHKKSKLKNQDGSPQLPLASALVEGEIAINFGKDVETLSIKNESGDVVTFSSDNYYTEQKLGSGFTGANSAITVTQVIDEIDFVTSTALSDLEERKLDVSAYTPTDLSNYYTKTETSGATEISAALDDKQNTLSAGTGIEIIGDVISVTGGIITVDQVLDNTTSASTNPVSSKAVYDAVTDNELVWTNAYVAMSGTVSAHTANTSIHLTSADKTKLDSITGTIGSMAYENTSSYSSATEVNTALGGKANTATTLAGYGITNAYTKTEVDTRDLWVSGTGTSSVVQKGCNNTASGDYSVAEGTQTKATGIVSHAEGGETEAMGYNSHAEGYQTSAVSESSHAEGYATIAGGNYSHAEGTDTKASGASSHAEGDSTSATSYSSHAEGYKTLSNGNRSHAEGDSTLASGNTSHAEGYSTKALGGFSHAEGNNTSATSYSSHAEGNNTIASGNYSHAEGRDTSATSYASHAEGYSTKASGNYSHAEGRDTKASGNHSHTEGYYTSATSNSSHAEGNNTIASGDYSHVEGYNTSATSDASHAEGYKTLSNGIRSHAEGYNTIANGYASHAEGYYTSATSYVSHAEGYYTITLNNYEHASGQFNVSSSSPSSTFGDSGNTLFSVGNGTADDARHNAFEIRQNGDIYITSGNSDIKLQDYIGSVETVSAITPSNSGSTAPIATKVVAENELVMANALNDLSTNKADKTEDLDGIKLKKITQSAYDALVQAGTVDPNTLYFITD